MVFVAKLGLSENFAHPSVNDLLSEKTKEPFANVLLLYERAVSSF